MILIYGFICKSTNDCSVNDLDQLAVKDVFAYRYLFLRVASF